MSLYYTLLAGFKELYGENLEGGYSVLTLV